ncbi:MAG: putative Ig domain-containing protein, partial [Ferruginibacter sp.]
MKKKLRYLIIFLLLPLSFLVFVKLSEGNKANNSKSYLSGDKALSINSNNGKQPHIYARSLSELKGKDANELKNGRKKNKLNEKFNESEIEPVENELERDREERELEGEGEENENAFDELDKALAYEFNMIKNPSSGRVPEGVFEAEKQQAKTISETSVTGRTTLANTFSLQGPNNLGGRTRTIAYDVRFNGTSNRIIMAGGVSGGVYKSIDDGANWVRKSPVGQHFSCTSIAQDTRAGFQDTWYYGVGEPTGNSAGATGAFYSGNGVYKSTDNGETWSRLPNSNTSALESFSTAADFITKVIVDPTNGNVYAACASAILRSVDAGLNWSSVLSGTLTSTNNFTDIVVTTAGKFYASFAGSNSVGSDGVWSSLTGAAASWTRIAGPAGTPAGWNANGSYGRVVLAIAPSNNNLVYALYYNNFNSDCAGAIGKEAEFFRWDNAVSTWTDLSSTLPDEAGCSNGNDPFAVQGGYDLVVAIKPDDPTVVFIGGTNIYRSATSGTSWVRIGGYATAANYNLYTNSHSDIHAIAFQPTSSSIMLCGNDGGIQRTTNDLAATVAWTPINTGYTTYQYYYVCNDPRSGNTKVIGGAQDNGSTRNIGGTGVSFESVFGGDGVSVGLSGATDLEYVGSQNGNIYRRTAASGTNFGTNITPTFANTILSAGLFVTLFKLDPDNTERLYYVNDDTLHLTTTASTVTSGTWSKMTGVATTVGLANDITALALTRGTYNAATSSLFMGTSNGKVYRLDDPTGVAVGTAPVNITGASFPANSYVSSIAVNPRNDDTVLVTFSNYGITNVWWTGNANVAVPTWTAVEGALTLPSYRSSAIAINGVSSAVEYYVGTSSGLWAASGLPGSVAWAQEGASSMGNAVISDLNLRPSDNKLLVGTHGYGMWSTFIPSFVCAAITVTNPVTNTGTANTSFSQTFTQSGAVGGATFTLNTGTLPTGLTLSTAGVLSGIPTQTGSFPITVKVTGGNGCTGTGGTYTLVISCQTITVTNPVTTTGAVGSVFNQTFTQSGAIGSTTFTLNTGTLPAGLTLSSAGILSGTPTQSGSFPLTVKVTDGNGCIGTGGTYTLVISCQAITVTNPAT